MRRRVAALLAVLIASHPSGAAAAARVMHHPLRAEDGLVQSQVNAVLEASDGSVWFGTFGGVSHWDGTRFENFQLQDGLAGMDVRGFHETADGDILVSTADNGICRFSGGVFTTISTEQGLPAVSTRGFHRDDDGQLYVATADGLFVFADEALELAAARHELPGVRVSGFADRRAGGFYLSTFSHGVLVHDRGGAVPLLPADDLPGRIVRAVHERPDGTVLISIYRQGVWTWRDGVLAPFAHNGVLDGHDVMAFAAARDGTIYMPTMGGGVAVLADGNCRLLTAVHGLADATCWAAHEGRDGTVYFGTWDGVNLYHPGRMATFDATTGLPEDNVTATAELKDGTLAVATLGGGVALLDGERVIRVLGRGEGLLHDRVWSLLAARDGSLYIGTHAGLCRWRDGRLSTVYHEPDDPVGRVYAMHEQEDGTLWLATYGGIRVVRDGRPQAIYEETGSHRSTVYAVAGTRAGDLLFGTAGGLVTVRDGQALPPPDDSPLADVHVWSIHEGADGTIYLGTNGEGLWIVPGGLDSGRPLEVLRKRDGLSENTIFGIAEDRQGRLYLTTQRGVSIVDVGQRPPAVRQIHAVDGLAGEECSQGACFLDGRGRAWFCTIRGLTVYDPASDLPVTRPPSVHWRSVRLFAQELSPSRLDGTAVFGHRENFFRFEFVAANPRAPHKVRYRHLMAGIDRDWVEDRETVAVYASLPPGSYTFGVMARNEWGYWSEPVSLGFRITPPYWKTWWFIALAATVAGGIVALLVLNRVRHLLAYEQLRTKIAADLHDDIGAGLTEVSIVGSVLAAKLADDERARVQPELDQLGTTSRQLVRSMSDIVWLVHPQRDSLEDLLTRLADGYRGVFQASGVDFRVENLASLAQVRLGMERRQHLFLIFKEAINNAVKYSGCRELRLSAVARGRRIEMILRDDGRGFDPARADGGNGLRNMRSRAERLGGVLTVDSEPGRGTTVTFVGG